MEQQYDVIVVGAGASGIPAAIGAARQGARVLLLEEDLQPGGACVDEYVCLNNSIHAQRGGVYGEIMSALMDGYYTSCSADEKPWLQWFFPADYLSVILAMINAESSLELRCGVTYCRPIVNNNAVEGVLVKDEYDEEQRIAASVVVDATGSAEIAAQAGVETVYGRESKKEYGEDPAPEVPDDKVQLCTWQYISQQLPGHDGAPMTGVQARPEDSGYGWLSEEGDEEGWARDAGAYLHWGCRVRCEDTRKKTAVARAQQKAMEKMDNDLQRLRELGYAVYLAPKIGVRESRRLVGEHVITANDLIEGVKPDDTIFVSHRGFDIWTEGKDAEAGYPDVEHHGIPYRSLIPKSVNDIIVVGKAISGTHVAMSAYRTQGIIGFVGEAGGVAAALCAELQTSPRNLSPDQLIDVLREPPHEIQIELDPADQG